MMAKLFGDSRPIELHSFVGFIGLGILQVIVKESTTAPGGRTVSDGPHSAEWFYWDVLRPKLQLAQTTRQVVVVDLDGTAGYAASWLDELFTRAVREFGKTWVMQFMGVKTHDEPHLLDDIKQFIDEA